MDRYDERNDPRTTSMLNQARAERPMSRIDNDVNTIKGITQRVRNSAERLLRHTQTLGYYNAPPAQTTGAVPSPVITTLSDALIDLDRAMDELASSLNLFD